MSALSCTTESLLRLMRAGDIAALDQLSICYGQRLAAVARRCCRRPDDAEDAVQQALLEAGRVRARWSGVRDPLAWLATLVSRSCGRLNRGMANDPSRHEDGVELPCACASPEAQAADHELGLRLSASLARLNRTDRVVLLLTAEGWTGPEIASELEISPDAVRSRLKRARQAVRADMERAELVDTVVALAGTPG